MAAVTTVTAMTAFAALPALATLPALSLAVVAVGSTLVHVGHGARPRCSGLSCRHVTRGANFRRSIKACRGHGLLSRDGRVARVVKYPLETSTIRRKNLLVTANVLFALALIGCTYDARYEDCAIACSTDTGCPENLTCGSEGLCRVQDAAALCMAPAASCTNVGDPTVDLALGRPAQADQVIDVGGVAAHGNDGDDTTRWNTGDGVPGHWWSVDLGSDRILESIKTLWEYDANYQYDVSTSSDGVSFTVAIDRTADTRSTRARTDMFPSGTCARYVRVRKTDTTGYWAILYTVNVLGK